MRTLLALLLLMALGCEGQDALPLQLDAPPGWRQEVITLPPEFAPEMSWTGVEVLRFSPGMFKPEQADFFSYAFLLKLDSGDPDWETQLLLYYVGLARAVSGDPNLDVSGFRVFLEGESEARYGSIQWTEPFVTKSHQKLNLECHQLSPELWFVCLSPQLTDMPIWTTLRRMRNDAVRSLKLQKDGL